MPVWRDSEYVCALADDERYFGHIYKYGEWHAFDATHLNDAADGLRDLGVFTSVGAAKRAVERSIARPDGASAADPVSPGAYKEPLRECPLPSNSLH